jgi:hypothetical protein
MEAGGRSSSEDADTVFLDPDGDGDGGWEP